MPREELKRYFDILELHSTASLRDVQNAYWRLKKLYAEGSLALAPLADEFPEKMRKKVLRQVEDAYAKLQAALKSELPKSISFIPAEPSTEKAPEEKLIEQTTFSGPALREVRERLGIRLDDISKLIKLRVELLKNIEEEKFDGLPEASYLKGQLKSLAGCLLLNPDKVAEDYLRRYQARKSK